MIWILIALASLACIELFLRLPVIERTRGVLTTSRRSIKVVASKAISDHWKELVLPRYSLRMASGSLAAAGLMILAFSPIIALALVGPLFGADVMGLLLSWQGIVGISLFAALYVFLRNRLFDSRSPDAGGSAYSPMAKLTHRLALAAPSRGELLLDLEHASAPKPPDGALHGQHIFVAGLARAGTTVLMRAIYESGGFASLTYRDMPFVMAPNLWAKISRRSQRAMHKAERAHGDSVLVDFDSPEALEEPFWRAFCGQDYIKSDRLVPHTADEDAIATYRKFVGHVLVRYGADRYLAKNNNNILRLPTLLKAFPAATVVIPFRQPIAQATSLLDQHQRFLASDDAFTQDYMGWLAHHEFGPGHRPFSFSGSPPADTPKQIDYWLKLWIDVHRYLLETIDSQGSDGRLIPVAYEDVCSPDGAIWQALCRRVGIAASNPDLHARVIEGDGQADQALLSEASGIYGKLQQLSRTILKAEG